MRAPSLNIFCFSGINFLIFSYRWTSGMAFLPCTRCKMCISCASAVHFSEANLSQSLTENNKLINQGVLQSWDACKGQSSDSYCVALCFHAVTLHGKCSFLLCYLDYDRHLCVKEPAVHFYLRPVKLFTGDVDVDQLSALIFGPQFPKRSFLSQTHVFFSPSFQQ